MWRGESEAIVVPHIALASDGVDLELAPASAAATAMSRLEATAAKAAAPATTPTKDAAKPAPTTATKADAETDKSDSGRTESSDKDATGVADPWGLPPKETAAATPAGQTANGSRLLTKFNT